MGWLNFGGKKRDRAQGFGDSSKTKSRKRPKSFILEKIVTPSAGFGDWEHEFDQLHQLLGSLSLSDLHLPNFFADSGVCPIDPSGPTNNLPPLIDFDPLGLYHDGIATQTPYTPGGAFETLPIALIPVDPQAPNPSNPNAIRQLLDFPFVDQPLLGSIDTGVSADSPYLNYANIKKGRDYVGGDDNPLLKPGEGSEHGTFMLGIIDAINKTAPKWVGRAIDSGRWADSLVEFVDAAKASGQKNAIANLSLDLTQKNADGSVTTRYELTPQERSAIEYARQNGVMLVVAAGNDGGVMSVLGQASQEFDNIFTVGAGDINGRSIYSSYGRGLDIVADGGTTEHPGLSTVGNDLGTMAGTSVATAKVAGAASLVWAANPALNYRQVMEILEKTARDLGTPGRDDETGFGFLNTLAAVELAKKTTPEVYNPTPWVTPGTWSGEGKVTPEERAAKGGNSIAAATVQVLTNFSDSDRVDASQPDKYYQFTVNEPGYVKWNLISLNPVSGFPEPPNVTIIKADGKPGSHIFTKGLSLSSSVRTEGQTSFSGGDFYNSGTYYLKVGNGDWSTFKDYNISTQFTADRVSSFAGNIQYRTQPYYSLQDSPQSAVFSGPAVSELKNLAGVVTYDNIQVNNRIAKYGIEVNELGKFRINLNSPNGKMELSVKKFIGSDDRPESIASLAVSANSDGWLELQLNKGRYDIEVKTPSNYWQEPDWNSTQQRLVRPYTLNATFTPNAPQPGQGKVPASAGAFDKTVVSSGVVNHYYKNGYLTVQPSGQASWYGYPSLVISGSAQVISKPVPLTDPDGNYSIQTAENLLLTFGGADLGDGVNKDQVASGRILSSIGGKDLNDFYKFSLNSSKLVNLELSQFGSGAEWSLIKDRNGNGQVDPGEVIKLGNIVTESQSLDLILGAGNYYLQIGSAASNAASQYVVNVVATPPENEVISSYNSDYFLVQNGQRRLVPDRETLNGLGINPNTVKRFSNEDLALIPLGQPLSPPIPQWQKSIDDAANQNSLGNRVTGYWDAADSPTGTKGYGRTYDRGSVYWTAKSGAIALVGQFADAYHSNENNGSKGWLGFPTAKQWNWEGGQRIDFEGGYIYRTAKEGIRAFKYDESPWQKSIDAEYAGHKGLLGNPTTGYWQAADSQTGTKGYGQNYNNGHVFWTAKYGAIALWHGFADTYNQTGGSNGWLGFPTKGKETDSSGGQRIDFEGGYIYWTAQSGAKAYRPNESPSLDKTVGYDGTNTHQTYVNTFNNNGGLSALGSATGNVHPSGTENGYIQEFSGGSEGSGAIMKSGANDNSYWVGGGFWSAYQKIMEQKDLGYPTSDRFPGENGLLTQNFQKGKIVQDGDVYKFSLSSGDSGGSNSKLPRSAAEAQVFFKNQFQKDPGLPAPPNNNCGPASLAIVLKALGLEPSGIGEQASINQAAELMGLNPTNHPDASDVDIERGIQNAGGTWINVGIGSTDQRWNTLNEALANQNPVIAFGNANPEWWSQIGYTNIRSVNHVIAILGRTSNGNYIVADPLSSRAVEVSQLTLSKFFSIYNNAPAGRAFVLPTSNPGNGGNGNSSGNVPTTFDLNNSTLEQRMLYVMKLLVNKYNYPVNAAAGLVGNLQAESNVLPNIIEGGTENNPMLGLTAEQAMSRKDGIGLAQWTWAPRRNGLFEYKFNGEQLGANILFNMDAQVDYLVYELKNSYPGVNQILMNPGVKLNEASDKVLIDFENPAEIENNKIQRRIYAANALTVFSNA